MYSTGKEHKQERIKEYLKQSTLDDTQDGMKEWKQDGL